MAHITLTLLTSQELHITVFNTQNSGLIGTSHEDLKEYIQDNDNKLVLMNYTKTPDTP